MERIKDTAAMQKKQVFNAIILDRSGSMQRIRQAAVDGFNETLARIKKVQEKFADTQEYFVSLDSMEVAMSMSIRNARNFDYSSKGIRASMRKDTMVCVNFFSRLSQMEKETAFCADLMLKEERQNCYGRLADEAFDEEENK